MIQYKDYQPTSEDPKGCFLPDHQDWLVVPVVQTRDSDILSQSNFQKAQDLLMEIDEEGEDFEVHRFGHWGPGWYEIILVKPNSLAAEKAQELENALADYPVLDEMHYSQMEWEAHENNCCDEYCSQCESERLEHV